MIVGFARNTKHTACTRCGIRTSKDLCDVCVDLSPTRQRSPKKQRMADCHPDRPHASHGRCKTCDSSWRKQGKPATPGEPYGPIHRTFRGYQVFQTVRCDTGTRTLVHAKCSHHGCNENLIRCTSAIRIAEKEGRGLFCEAHGQVAKWERIRASGGRIKRTQKTVYAECHPKRKHHAKGLCTGCYERQRVRDR